MGTRFEVDEIKDELVIEKESLLGLRRTQKRIPLSTIEEITVHRHHGGRHEMKWGCYLLVDGSWEVLTDEPGDVLRAARVVGRHIVNPEKKLQELADHLSRLFRVTAAIADEGLLWEERKRQLCESIDVKIMFPDGGRMGDSVSSLMVEGIVRFQGHDIDSVEVLHYSNGTFYLLGYVIGGATAGSIRTTRRKKNVLFGDLVKVEWKGASFANELNSDVALQQLLLSHLRNPDCDAYITTDLSAVNTMLIFGDSYPRRWVRLPSGLFPSETRATAVTLLAKKIRSSIR